MVQLVHGFTGEVCTLYTRYILCTANHVHVYGTCTLGLADTSVVLGQTILHVQFWLPPKLHKRIHACDVLVLAQDVND